MNSVLIGYFPKERTRVPPGFPGTAAREICSVSEHLAPGPPDWIKAWRHNEWGFFNTLADARAVLPADRAATFEIFGYALYPLRHEPGGAVCTVEVEARAVEALPAGFASIGFDVPSKSLVHQVAQFECSPLSCNAMAGEIPVNVYCLLDRLDVALDTARRFAREQPEPGEYYVVEVFRSGAPAYSGRSRPGIPT